MYVTWNIWQSQTGLCYHEGKYEGGGRGLDDPEGGQGRHLDGREQVDLPERDVPQIHRVWLVLGRHEEQHTPVYKLHSIECVDPHVHEDAVEDRHGDVFEDGGELDGESGEYEDTDARDSLLSHPLKLRSVARSRGLAVHLETVHVSKAEDSGGHAPGKPQ